MVQGRGKPTSKPVKGSDLMIGCWNFSMRVGGLKSFLLGSDLTRSFIKHHILILNLNIYQQQTISNLIYSFMIHDIPILIATIYQPQPI